MTEARQQLEGTLSTRIRDRARKLGVSAASVMHLAWALVLARASGRSEVVFGTVLFGRMQGGAHAERVLGMFINTLPVRIRLGEHGVARSVRDTHALLVELLRHEHAPLALAQRCSGVPAQTPLFSALLNYRHSSRPESVVADGAPGAARDGEVLWGEERTNYPLTLSVDDLGDDFALTVQAGGRVDPARVCAMMATALANLLQTLEQSPASAVGRVDVLPAPERHRVLVEWNATAASEPGSERCFHELFEAHAERAPDAVALDYGEGRVRYGELNARANRLAHRLRRLGVEPDARVAICAERGVEMVVAVLATLKAGGAYVPLDPAYPAGRLSHMLEDSAPVAVLVDRAGRAAVSGKHAASQVDLDLDAAAWAGEPEGNPGASAVGLAPGHLAYVIYTSGSTGTPKGVMNEHRGLSNLVRVSPLGVGPDSRVLQFASPSFDASVWEVAMALGSGATLCLSSREGLVPGRPLLTTLRDQRITHVLLPPSALPYCEDAEIGFAATTLIVGGEAVPMESANRWSSRLTLINAYGPTESTVCTSTHLCAPGSEVVPIGRPMPNTRMYILDAQREPVPIGVCGELYIGGVGVARGYLNLPELTSERFLRDPFGGESRGRMYRTGDLGRWLPDGTVEFLGRNDFQVKLRGFRIELGEIESRLSEVAGVLEVAVLAREDEPGDKRLVAYYAGTNAPEAEALRQHAREGLPEYMVPAAYVRLEALPRTSSGKLDRKALPVPDGDAYVTHAYEAPQGPAETALAAIWSEVLKRESVGRSDNFFEQGGHSLLAVALIERIRRAMHVDVPLAELFAHPVLRDLAAQVAGAPEVETHAIPLVARGGSLPTSLGQQRLWLLCQFEGVSRAYHISGGIRLQGRLDRTALRRALDGVVARHEVLRTRFVVVNGQPEQVIEPADRGLPVQEHDLRESADRERDLALVVEQESASGFDLEKGPLVRARLVALGEDDHALLLTMHHVVSDGWSMGILVNEVSALYRAFRNGTPSPLPALAIQYADYASWQRQWLAGDRLRHQSDYWREALAGAPVRLDVPGDRARPSEQSYAGGLVPVAFDSELRAGLKSLARRHGGTLYMALLAGWAAVLGRLAGQDDVVVGSPVAGRARTETEPLIGFFVNTLAMRLKLEPGTTVADLLRQTRAQVLAAQEHGDLPFEQVVEVVQPPRSLAHTPIFQVMFSWQNTPDGELTLEGLKPSSVDLPYTTAQLDLTLELHETDEGIRGAVNYATALFDRATVERYVGYLRRVLEEMVRDDAQRLSAVPWMSVAERQRVLVDWNTAREYPQERCLHELFEAQVERAPDAVALVFGEETLSYGELNARANRLAHALRGLGLEPDARVAICVERGRRDGRGDARDAQGGRRVRAARPRVPGDPLAAHAGRQRAGGVARRRTVAKDAGRGAVRCARARPRDG